GGSNAFHNVFVTGVIVFSMSSLTETSGRPSATGGSGGCAASGAAVRDTATANAAGRGRDGRCRAIFVIVVALLVSRNALPPTGSGAVKLASARVVDHSGFYLSSPLQRRYSERETGERSCRILVTSASAAPCRDSVGERSISAAINRSASRRLPLQRRTSSAS